MEINIKVPQEVLDIVYKKGVCYAKNETSFSEFAYNYLKELTGYKGLFFGILNNQYMIDRQHMLYDCMDMSTEKNSIYLLLDIPNSEYLPHEYYSFTDLIYYHDEDDHETVDIILKDFTKPSLDMAVQCVFNRIEKSWIKDIKHFRKV